MQPPLRFVITPDHTETTIYVIQIITALSVIFLSLTDIKKAAHNAFIKKNMFLVIVQPLTIVILILKYIDFSYQDLYSNLVACMS